MASGGSPASGGSTPSGSGGSPSDGFEPCPASGPCKILPLGDSITFGLGSSGGYRVQLFADALAHGDEITFVGSQMNGPEQVQGQPFPKNHEGYSGYTIAQVQDLFPEALAGPPHIVLVHLGTNDMYLSPAGADARLGTFIDAITTALPEALVVVATLIPFPGADAAVSTYNAAVPDIVRARANAGAHVLLIDQFSGFPADEELGDGVHPNTAGYARMGDRWYEAVQPYLR